MITSKKNTDLLDVPLDVTFVTSVLLSPGFRVQYSGLLSSAGISTSSNSISTSCHAPSLNRPPLRIVMVQIEGQMQNNTGGDGAVTKPYYGTGSAPANGAAVTSTSAWKT